MKNENKTKFTYIYENAKTNNMDIFYKMMWEKEHNETIQHFYDIEGWEARERKPIGQYGYKVIPTHMYKFVTNKSIYFIEDGKCEKVHTFPQYQ